jgi:hypothetical protein
MGTARDAQDGVEMAAATIDDGSAQDFLQRLAGHFAGQ